MMLDVTQSSKKSSEPDVPNFFENGRRSRSDGPRTLVDEAYDHLLGMLVSVRIAPGERIRIESIARELGISQTPVREALSQLEAEKMAFKVPNVGYRASPQMTHEQIHDLYTLRLLIEPYAAARAAESMTDETMEEVREIDREMSGIVDGNDSDYVRFAEADARLHRLIAQRSGNALIADTIERLHAHLHIFRALYQTNAPAAVAAEHRAIIDALLARDPDAAEAATRMHLALARRRLDVVSTGEALSRDKAS